MEILKSFTHGTDFHFATRDFHLLLAYQGKYFPSPNSEKIQKKNKKKKGGEGGTATTPKVRKRKE